MNFLTTQNFLKIEWNEIIFPTLNSHKLLNLSKQLQERVIKHYDGIFHIFQQVIVNFMTRRASFVLPYRRTGQFYVNQKSDRTFDAEPQTTINFELDPSLFYLWTETFLNHYFNRLTSVLSQDSKNQQIRFQCSDAGKTVLNRVLGPLFLKIVLFYSNKIQTVFIGCRLKL